ncbi:alpha/beta fold hydrolase [Nocardia sp. NBC_01009]|uniref:alpha/beta fold hydrolase n=1 Tax=Nocardia sp. NBC_01009 TaxID=2975996 RepID=UPI00386C764D|nr:alpha/beta fold hydrolase [Nocardia sp. NBC_01009]
MEETLSSAPDAVVFGATGLIGKWTVLHLLDQGRAVAAVIRNPAQRRANAEGEPRGTREDELRVWLGDRGVAADRLTVVSGDFTKGTDLGLSQADDDRLAGIRDVFNVAGIYRFGLQREEASAVNVEGALNVLYWSATRRALRRLIHVSGYRVGSDPEPRYPLPEEELAKLYRGKGAYEGSKTEADAAMRVIAAQSGVPLTVVNPSSVIGHSETGEVGQYLGLAEVVRDLWMGKLPALPGTARTFVPVVAVDHFAKFMAAIPDYDPEPGGLHWVLDANTPNLPDLVRLLADHLGVRAPKTQVPVGLIRSLPTALTGVNPETLTFLSEDRYDTTSTDKVARAAGLQQPRVETVLRRWADRLVSDGFGATPTDFPGGFHEVGGSRTFVAGDSTSPDFVLLHGIPLDGDSWQGVISELDNERVLVADLPGLGRSTATAATPLDWVTDLLKPVRTRPILVAHSAAAAPALRYAAAHPERIAAVLVISPYFLQARPNWLLRTPMLAAPLLRRMSADRLASTLLGDSGALSSEHIRRAIESAQKQLQRPGVARRVANWLRAANQRSERAALQALLDGTEPFPVPVHIVAGSLDPLIGDSGDATVVTVTDSGHYPQLTHPSDIVATMRSIADRSIRSAASSPSRSIPVESQD